jgi:DNA-binding MarR family transcriptional regulator/N-acetylglutamate synthase-like GNAT family acetyltransferase
MPRFFGGVARGNLDRRTDAVRRFNRFYTRQAGLLQEGLLGSPFSLTEARVLYELAHRDRSTAAEIGNELGLDAGYLSRILASFGKRQLLAKTPSGIDRRKSFLTLTKHGRKVFAPLETRSKAQVATRLAALPESDQRRLISAMEAVQGLLGKPTKSVGFSPEPYLLRPHQPGDMGWVVHRHGVLYAQEYGYDQTFEALVAEIVAKFIQHYHAQRERCWIAEREGEIAGSVFLVTESKTVAKLRLLLVEPSARGLGIGARLVAECVGFARQADYQKIVLWTQDELDAARHVYKKAGFQVVEKKHHHSFGKDLTAETWELVL